MNEIGDKMDQLNHDTDWQRLFDTEHSATTVVLAVVAVVLILVGMTVYGRIKSRGR